VKDLRDVYIRFNQAESWYERYHVQRSVPLVDKWLEYLQALNLEQFDTDIWKAMLKSNKRCPELISDAIERKGKIRFCHHDMKRIRLGHWIIRIVSRTLTGGYPSRNISLDRRVSRYTRIIHTKKVQVPPNTVSIPSKIRSGWIPRESIHGLSGYIHTHGQV
jgi:hypothetical protein